MTRPSFIPADSAVSYFEVREVSGYSYRRYLGYTYRVKRGRRKRVHHYRLVVVAARSVLYWIIEAPPAPPKPPPPKAAPAAPPPPKGWIKAAEWQSFLDQWAETNGFDLIKWDGDIYKKSPANDWISPTLFVWPTPRYPRNVTLPGYKILGRKIFNMIRLWVHVEDPRNSEILVWVRTIRNTKNMTYDFNRAVSEILPKAEAAIASTVAKFPYLMYRGLVAWTLYQFGTGTKRKVRKEGTE